MHSTHILSNGHEFAYNSCRNDFAHATGLFDPESLESATGKEYLAGLIEEMPENWLLRRRSEAARPGLAKPDHTCIDTAARNCAVFKAAALIRSQNMYSFQDLICSRLHIIGAE